MRVKMRDRVSLEVLDDAHRVVAALPGPVDTEREARRGAQSEGRLPRAVDVLDGQPRELR